MSVNIYNDNGDETDEDDNIIEKSSGHVFQPEWVNVPTLVDLKSDVSSSDGDHAENVTRIEEYLSVLDGEYNGPKIGPCDTPRSSVQPRTVRKAAETRYATFSEPYLSNFDMFNLDPVGRNDKQSSEQNEIILNNQMNTKINKVRFVDTVTRRLYDEGVAIVRVGWKSAIDPDAEIVDMIDESGRPIKVRQQSYLYNHPTLEVCDFRSVVLDHTVGDCFEDSQRISYTFETTRASLRATNLYKNLDFITESNYSSDGLGADDSSSFVEKEQQKIHVTEMWCYRDIYGDGTQVSIVTAWCGDVMIRLEENPYPDKSFPFVVIPLLPIKDSLYGESEGSLISDSQAIIGAVTRSSIDIVAKIASNQKAMKRSAIDMTERAKMAKGQNFYINESFDIKDAVQRMETADVPAALHNMKQEQEREVAEMTGVVAGDKRELPNAANTRVRSTTDPVSKRESSILRRISAGYCAIARKIISMNAEFLAPEEVVRITDNEFVTIRRDDLRGESDIRINISTPEADEEKAKELAFITQALNDRYPPTLAQVLLIDMVKLRGMPALADKIAAVDFTPQPPTPEEQMMQQLEMEKAVLANEQAKATIQKTYAEAYFNNLRADKERAEAGKLGAQEDAINLTFVEDEQGVTHARAVDIVQAQAEAQTKMKIVESRLEQIRSMGDNSVAISPNPKGTPKQIGK